MEYQYLRRVPCLEVNVAWQCVDEWWHRIEERLVDQVGQNPARKPFLTRTTPFFE